MSEENEPKLFPFDEIEWVNEAQEGTGDPALVAEAARTGARRKKLARGEGGFHLQYTTMPPGFAVPLHSHDFDELFIVLAGGCTFWPDGPDHSVELEAKDSVTLAAHHRYAFTCGNEGMEFYVVRLGEASATRMG